MLQLASCIDIGAALLLGKMDTANLRDPKVRPIILAALERVQVGKVCLAVVPLGSSLHALLLVHASRRPGISCSWPNHAGKVLWWGCKGCLGGGSC